jgi:hypothetical protein
LLKFLAEKIPINFEHKGKKYSGILSTVVGMGHASAWHLLIENRYYGCLMNTNRGWINDTTDIKATTRAKKVLPKFKNLRQFKK